MSKKVWVCAAMMWAVVQVGFGQTEKDRWVDSVMATLSQQEKITQLMMIQAEANPEDIEKLFSRIENHAFGGVVFTGGSLSNFLSVNKKIAVQKSIPLLIGINAQDGLGTVLDSAMVFPPAIMTGALTDDSLHYYMGRVIGNQLRQSGTHITFAPVADLSTAFDAEQIIRQTYGSNKDRVTRKVTLFTQGLRDAGVFTVVRHYPNTGMKISGFQRGKPILTPQNDREHLYVLEHVLQSGSDGILLANQQDDNFPDKRNKIITSKSRRVAENVPSLYYASFIKRQLNFEGLTFSYIPDLHKTVGRRFRAGDSELFALKAGNDVLLFPRNVTAAIRKIRKAAKRDDAFRNSLDERVRKILALKYSTSRKTKSTSAIDHLASVDSKLLQHELYAQSVVVVKNENDLLPISTLDNRSFASVSIGGNKENDFNEYVSRYITFEAFEIRNAQDTIHLIDSLKNHHTVFVSIHQQASALEDMYPNWIKQLGNTTNVVVILFDSPAKISLIENARSVVQAFMDEPIIQKIVPQILFGALPATATLPITISDTVAEGIGVETNPLNRIAFALPEAAGVNGNQLAKIDAIVREAIEEKATPGCQIVVIRKGKVIYEKSFGWHTYEKSTPVTRETIYDLASITKVAATLQGTMFLYDKHKIDLNHKASLYLSDLTNSNKKDIIIKDILTHQAGLWPFLPFWMQTKKDTTFLPEFYSYQSSGKYNLQVSSRLFGATQLRDSVWTWIVKSKMREKPVRTPYSYTYSDIGLYIMHRMNEVLLNQPQEDFLQQNIYEPLGAHTLGYLPLKRFDRHRIAPTENDKTFRGELLIGTVHDEGAALLGGVAGHAGLFGNALDLAKLGQMLLQKGNYGGYQFFKPETVELFTNRQFETNRRGLGWDKPVLSDWNTPTSIYSSHKTFGHTGFTGTAIWIDPEFDLVYVFLSNRVYPTRNGNKLSALNIRSRIQDVIYQSIFSYSQYQTQPVWSKLK